MPDAKSGGPRNGAMPGPVATVAEFRDAGGEGGQSAEDLLDRVAAIWASRGLARVESQRSLAALDEVGHVIAVGEALPGLAQDDLRGALDEFLRATDGQPWVSEQACVDSLDGLVERAGVGDVAWRRQTDSDGGGAVDAASVVEAVALSVELVAEAVEPGVLCRVRRCLDLADGLLEGAERAVDVPGVGPVNGVEVRLVGGSAFAGLSSVVGAGCEAFVLPDAVDDA